MRFGVTIITTDLVWRIDELAPEIEARGFTSFYIPEHTHIPTSLRTPPATGEDELAEHYKRMLDPFIALAAASSVTTDLRLGTGIALLAQREPIVTAKQIATLDHLSGGRVELGLTPLARVVASGVTALDPEIMGLGPIEASRQALGRAGMTIDQIDLVEINEAFAAQAVPSAKHLGISWDKLNTRGGAIAIGHPFGMTGARIMTTLIHALQDEDKTFGLETMCVGGGQGMAMVIERLS